MGSVDPPREPDHVRTNRESWTRANASYTDSRAAEAWARAEIEWGLWDPPEREVRVLPEVDSRDVIELGCGTAYYACRSGPGFYGCGRMRITADRPEHTVVERLLGLEAAGKLRAILYAERTVKLEDAERELETVKGELRELAHKRYSGQLMPEEVEGARQALLERRRSAEKVIQAAQREIGLPNLPDPLAPAWDALELHEKRSILKAALLSVRVVRPGWRGPGFDPIGC